MLLGVHYNVLPLAVLLSKPSASAVTLPDESVRGRTYVVKTIPVDPTRGVWQSKHVVALRYNTHALAVQLSRELPSH